MAAKHPVFRGAAIASALVLVGGYVWVRATGISPVRALMPSTKSGRVVPADAEVELGPATAPTTRAAEFLPGSKSAAIFHDDAPVVYGDEAVSYTANPFTTAPSSMPATQP
jgi:hypothetical protein